MSVQARKKEAYDIQDRYFQCISIGDIDGVYGFALETMPRHFNCWVSMARYKNEAAWDDGDCDSELEVYLSAAECREVAAMFLKAAERLEGHAKG